MLQWIIKHNCCPQEVFNLALFYTDFNCFKFKAIGMTSAGEASSQIPVPLKFKSRLLGWWRDAWEQ